MGFRKADNPKEILIAVEHAWHRGTEFVFPLAKRLSQEALDAQEAYFALKDDEASDVRRKARTRVLGLMLTREPEGFDDFAGVREAQIIAERSALLAREEQPKGFDADAARADIAEAESRLLRWRQIPLVDRFVEYFDDDSQPELERIVTAAWNRYWQEAVPLAYLKSPEDSRARDGQLSRVSRETTSAV
jgi:hypothetical protein